MNSLLQPLAIRGIVGLHITSSLPCLSFQFNSFRVCSTSMAAISCCECHLNLNCRSQTINAPCCLKYQPGPGIFLTHLICFVFFSFCSMEQSIGQNVNMNHAAELDQILASYKVCVDLLFSYVRWPELLAQTCYKPPF